MNPQSDFGRRRTVLGVSGGAGKVEVAGGRGPAGQQVQCVLCGRSGLGGLGEEDALVELADLEEPPVHFAAGVDALTTFEQKAKDLFAQAEAHRELSTSLAHGNA